MLTNCVKTAHRSLISVVDVSFSVIDAIQHTHGKSINDQQIGLNESRQNCRINNPDRRPLLVFSEHTSSALARQNTFT